jgi:hypothetical protein
LQAHSTLGRQRRPAEEASAQGLQGQIYGWLIVISWISYWMAPYSTQTTVIALKTGGFSQPAPDRFPLSRQRNWAHAEEGSIPPLLLLSCASFPSSPPPPCS